MSQRLYKTIYEIARTVNSSLDPSEVMAAIAKEVSDAMEAKGCFIRVLDTRETMLKPGGFYGLSERYAQKGPVEVGKSRLDQEVLEGRTVTIADVRDDDRFQYPKEASEEGIVSLVVVPLNARDRVIGVLRVYSGEARVFSEEEMDFLQCIANLSGLALENARMYKALKRASELADEFNYRVFED
ncbi:GAF domain-containing protein [Pseudodesulfovibrio cashew]|uniref:GAF domain-containing protein n=1 Tax=Pseudodesulfovibrio cashew TaxID=2678688 RepID=A0A6I6JPX8_9BACT|nr:GAF domain-containing protein [Pseudodesulfovibrio cashew]QGY39704.1 GAF domain-containing protein [Pseudodesulfovibrio cashew]